MEAPDPANVRIVTTLGHVDHGKTTLMDALLAANNIISARMAGKMRYLDSRDDEQERGITMESSTVSLRFHVMEHTSGGGSVMKNYIVNMIDTPGHVDFSSEVSTASRLCDGALVLVDVVEGVCTQTIAVLRQAWLDRLRPILVINKLDRLITELKLSPVEGYQHLSRLIEQVNAVMGGFFASDRMEDDLRWREEHERRLEANKNQHAEEVIEDDFEEMNDEDIYFSPERGNVIFASAIDGWGFRIGKFAQLFATKLGIKEANLKRVLWGDFFFDPKTKKVINYKHLKGRSLKPLFVQLVLDNIWAVYDGIVLNPNMDKVTKIAATLNLKILPRDLKSKDTRHLLSLIFSQWLSLSTCIVQAVIDVVPAPSVAQAIRIPKMMYPNLHEPTIAPKSKLEEDLFASKSSPSTFVSAYISKMFAVSRNQLPENKRSPKEMKSSASGTREKVPIQDSQLSTTETSPHSSLPDAPKEMADNAEVLLGFARLYSGIIRIGTRVYGILPKYNSALEPSHPHNAEHIVSANVEGLYIMMGRELVGIDSVRAGNIFAIKGLEGKVWRSATLCAPDEAGFPSDADLSLMKDCFINLGGVNRSAPPIVRVALEPVKSADMSKLVEGLKLLSQSDPCVETFQQPTGEHVILAAGELHLERCLKDLRERFAQVEIQASKPIVPFRETAVKSPDMVPPKTTNAPRGTIRGASSQNYVTFTIRAVPLPRDLLQFILDNVLTLKTLHQERKLRRNQLNADHEQEYDIRGVVFRQPSVRPEKFWGVLREKCDALGGLWEGVADRIWAFGPQKAGGCMLIDGRKTATPQSLQHRLEQNQTDEKDDQKADHDFDSHVETGFQLATFQGPLCAEPVEGLAYFVEALEIDRTGVEKETEQNRLPQISGSLISAVRDACKSGLLDWSPRLMLAMYTCEIQASTEVLGKVYGVVAKRRGRILAEEMKEGTSFFNVSALLPVAESFGFADDIRKRTSGAASPQLIFSGYELLDQDPFWMPSTEEELEDLGEKSDRMNVAKTYMDGVRERKGMFVDRKIVEFAEKQRTLKR